MTNQNTDRGTPYYVSYVESELGFRLAGKEIPKSLKGPLDVTVEVNIQNDGHRWSRCFRLEQAVGKFVSDERVRTIRMSQPEYWSVFDRWTFEEFPDFDYPALAEKLVIDRETLDGIFTACRQWTTWTKGGEYMARLFSVFMAGRDEDKKKIFSDWILENTRYTRQFLYKDANLHQWLCDNGFVKASNYEEILNSVEPSERAVLIAYAKESKLLEKVEKLKYARSLRPMSVEEARKLWTLRERGNHYEIEWKHNDASVCNIPDKIGSKSVILATVCLWNGDAQIDSMTVPAGVRLKHGNLNVADFRNYSNILYPMDWAAAGCPEVFEIPADKTVIAEFAFAVRKDGKRLKKIMGLDHVTTIERGAFRDTPLDEEFLEIPRSVTSVGEDAFNGCSVKSFRLNDELETIGTGAFRGCEKIFCSPAMAARLANR